MREVIRRTKRARPVESAARTLAPLLDEAMATRLCGVLAPGEQLPDLAPFSRLIGAWLEKCRRVMESAASHLADVRGQLRRLRRERDRVSEDLRQQLLILRLRFDGMFRKEPAESFLLLRGETPRDPVELLIWASRAAGRLRDRGVVEPPSVWSGVILERASLAKFFEGYCDRLGQLLRAINDAESQEKHAISELDAAKKSVDRETGRVARFLEAAHELAGNEADARRIRPGVKRRGRPKKSRLKTGAGVSEV